MTLEQRVEALEQGFEFLKKQVKAKDEQLTCFENILRNRIDEFSAYIDTATLNAPKN